MVVDSVNEDMYWVHPAADSSMILVVSSDTGHGRIAPLAKRPVLP